MSKIIAAPATAPGIAGVSMIRVSGSDCIAKVSQCFQGKLQNKQSHEIAYGKIIDPVTEILIDEVMIAVFYHGRSFTGEESLEIWTHGSPYIVREVMRVLAYLGISTAEPGEFTMRAFLNGRIDLTQAEAIKDLVDSQTQFAHAQALGRLEGKLSKQINTLHSQVLDILALLETAIDHAEEEVDTDDLSERYIVLMDELANHLTKMISGAKLGKMSTDGIKIALIGCPNVGKSSLLNALVQENRVIVSDIAGTTRDVIEHRISARGLLIRFFDTAGLRATDDLIEKEGTKRSLETLDQADMVFHILDQSTPLQEEDQEIIDLLQKKDKKVITVFNKSDLPNQLKEFSQDTIYVSAVLQEGLERLFDLVAEYYFSGGFDPNNEIFIANIRQENLLQQAYQSLLKAKNTILVGESEEFTASHIRQLRIFLEEIVGKTTDDAILDRIFSQFCIGK
ncbi:MAG: tRNA uridine-5-carboxymethylaminomethyl(34) synthesis GTPase MnmE [Brevinema sp.]